MKKVLLIDDDPVTNFINRTIIEKTGLADEIIVAQSGQRGLDVLIELDRKGEPFPDLILLDINMPILNGFEFLQCLIDLSMFDQVGSKIVILSSSDSYEDKARADRMGVKTYLVKPADREEISALLA